MYFEYIKAQIAPKFSGCIFVVYFCNESIGKFFFSLLKFFCNKAYIANCSIITMDLENKQTKKIKLRSKKLHYFVKKSPFPKIYISRGKGQGIQNNMYIF